MLEKILSRENMTRAYKRVFSNKGASGVDGMTVEELKPFLDEQWSFIKAEILEGKYKPSGVKKVEIDKPGGGKRELGIPTVLDRLIQQAISQELSLQYDPTFSESSFGFRPGRKAHDAVRQGERYINEGNVYVIEIDLEKFFDKVNHDKLMHELSKRINDKQLLRLIRNYLKSGIMTNGIKTKREEGTPQGSPLSPLLSNVLLDELDKELERRGHKFVRYADDCSIYMKSEKAAKRVLGSITRFIERKLKLRVNQVKTKISRPERSNLLGFTFLLRKNKYIIQVSEKSVERLKEKIKRLTNKNHPIDITSRLKNLKVLTAGWVNYFKIAGNDWIIKRTDEWTRTRIRMCMWKSWKTPQNRRQQLINLGTNESEAIAYSYSRKGWCRIAHSWILTTSLTNGLLKTLGYADMLSVYLG